MVSITTPWTHKSCPTSANVIVRVFLQLDDVAELKVEVVVGITIITFVDGMVVGEEKISIVRVAVGFNVGFKVGRKVGLGDGVLLATGEEIKIGK